MPLLTSILMHDSKTDITTRMAIIKSSIQFGSLSNEEMFVKNAMKTNSYHNKAKSLLMTYMKKIIDGNDNKIRDVDISSFIEKINDEMLN